MGRSGRPDQPDAARPTSIEEMRRGLAPKDAGMVALKRIKANTIEKRLLTRSGDPNFGINFYILNAKGEYSGVSMYPSKYAVCTEAGPQTADTEPLIPTPLVLE
jgi:N4-(beta-N-acetylglucosaminyl)-L-asparaginase